LRSLGLFSIDLVKMNRNADVLYELTSTRLAAQRVGTRQKDEP